MSDYTKIFRVYRTAENKPFYMLNRRVIFPDTSNVELYDKMYISADTPWTFLSYKIYGSIDYWWVLCTLNKNTLYYAKENTTITYLKSKYISTVISNLTNI